MHLPVTVCFKVVSILTSLLALFQTDHASRSQVLGPEPQGLLHGATPGARAPDRPLGVGRPHHRAQAGVPTARCADGVTKQHDVHKFINLQLHTRVGT